LLIFGVPLLGACEDPLNVPNPDAPDRTRVLASPADLVQFTINNWASYHDALYGANDALFPQMLNMGMENFSDLNNFGMGPRGAIPRAFIDNGRGNNFNAGNYRDFVRLSRAAVSASVALGQFNLPGFTVGTANDDARAKAFGRFVLGVSLATIATVYDSAAIVDPADDPQLIPPLSHYAAVSAAGIASLDSAVAIAQAYPGAFPLAATWLNTSGTVTQARFIQIVRSYRARLRAAVARTPAERAAVDWNAVIADADNGITSDFTVQEAPASGWSLAWPVQHYIPGGWHRMHQFMIGMADTSGAYKAWLALPRLDRAMFLILTPDKRFPSGATRAAQQTAGGSTKPPAAGVYFRNRDQGEDVVGDPLGNSMYDHYRFRAFYDASRIGAFPLFTRAENDLLAAEGYIRQANWAQAMAKINVSRTTAGLPALVGITSLSDPVPGGNACVPEVPQPPSYNTAACGNIWEAMKWEKRMETAYTTYGAWFFDSRGWGDLPEGTPLQWPVPYQEMDTRVHPFYNLGGCGGSDAAAGPTTYGLLCTT
jgi:hypothetical protein